MFPKTFTKPHNLLLWTSIFKQPAWKEFMSLLAVRIWRYFIMLSSPGPKSLSYTFLWKMGKPITWLSVLHLLHASVFRNIWSRNEHCYIRTVLHYPNSPGSSMYMSVICADRKLFPYLEGKILAVLGKGWQQQHHHKHHKPQRPDTQTLMEGEHLHSLMVLKVPVKCFCSYQ